MKVMIMAGGTGGHIYPALSVAKWLLDHAHQVIWLGSKGGMEADIVPKYDIPIDYIAVKGLRGKGLIGWLLAPFKIGLAILQAFAVIKTHKPQTVLGMGGFASGPGGIASWLLHIPLVIHEQNAIAGWTNKSMQLFAKKSLQAFPGALKNAITVGNPVRDEIEQIESRAVHKPLRILLLGGSLGAQILNQRMAEVARDFASEIFIRHQCGRKHAASTQKKYQSDNSEILVFIDDMKSAYDWADVVIARSGAMSVFELSAAGKPALLVPFPYAVDDHQTANASFLYKHEAAMLIQQCDLSKERLSAVIQSWLDTPETLIKMGKKAKSVYVSGATEKVGMACLEVAQ